MFRVHFYNISNINVSCKWVLNDKNLIAPYFNLLQISARHTVDVKLSKFKLFAFMQEQLFLQHELNLIDRQKSACFYITVVRCHVFKIIHAHCSISLASKWPGHFATTSTWLPVKIQTKLFLFQGPV